VTRMKKGMTLLSGACIAKSWPAPKADESLDEWIIRSAHETFGKDLQHRVLELDRYLHAAAAAASAGNARVCADALVMARAAAPTLA
jgi:hypothetical protein